MMATYVGMFLGLVLGFAVAGLGGAALGTMFGFAMGMLWLGVSEAAIKVPADAVLVREEQRLLCIPKGQIATATFVRDANTSRWLDVERCSLCDPEDQVQCRKRCLAMIRDTLPPRKNPVRVDVPAGPTA